MMTTSRASAGELTTGIASPSAATEARASTILRMQCSPSLMKGKRFIGIYVPTIFLNAYSWFTAAAHDGIVPLCSSAFKPDECSIGGQNDLDDCNKVRWNQLKFS